MKKVKRMLYHVRCARNPEHIFPKVFFIEADSEQKESHLDVYCPFCDDFVAITVQGKVIPDEKLLRKFKEFI